jgi:hypothetical protein
MDPWKKAPLERAIKDISVWLAEWRMIGMDPDRIAAWELAYEELKGILDEPRKELEIVVAAKAVLKDRRPSSNSVFDYVRGYWLDKLEESLPKETSP